MYESSTCNLVLDANCDIEKFSNAHTLSCMCQTTKNEEKYFLDYKVYIHGGYLDCLYDWILVWFMFTNKCNGIELALTR
jgi:hypothetical protein